MTAIEFGVVLLRVFLGLQVASHGAQKLFGWFGGYGITGTGGWLEGLGFRPGRPFAIGAGLGELTGGLLLALGFLTPFGAAAVVAVMLTACFTAHQGKGFFVSEGGFELPLLIAVAAIALAFTGPARLSLDWALGLNLAGWNWGLIATALGLMGCAAPLAARAMMHRPAHRTPA